MRRQIALFFLFIYLSSGTEFVQLFKLPLVWEHFQEHRQQHSCLSFFAFLKMHYFNGDPQDADYQRDMQLPFKKPVPPFIISALLPQESVFNPSPVLPFQEQEDLLPSPSEARISGFSYAIWHPPKA